MHYPHQLRLGLKFRCADLAEVVEPVLGAWERAELPRPATWAAPMDGPYRPSSRVLDRLRKGTLKADTLAFEVNDDVHGAFYVRSGEDFWRFTLNCFKGALVPPGASEHLAGFVRLCRELLDWDRLMDGETIMAGGASGMLPAVAPGDSTSHLVVPTEGTAAAAYADPQVFWDSWDDVQRSGERALCTRALHAVTPVELYSAIHERQWALARAARAGGIKLYTPMPTEDELPLFTAEEPTLDLTGYIKSEKTVELTCAITDESHIAGWEIINLAEMRRTGKTASDEPIEVLRIVFIDEAAARRERRPLLDAGMQVWFYDTHGELLRLDE